jgi:hypothetical protein
MDTTNKQEFVFRLMVEIANYRLNKTPMELDNIDGDHLEAFQHFNIAASENEPATEDWICQYNEFIRPLVCAKPPKLVRLYAESWYWRDNIIDYLWDNRYNMFRPRLRHSSDKNTHNMTLVILKAVSYMDDRNRAMQSRDCIITRGQYVGLGNFENAAKEIAQHFFAETTPSYLYQYLIWQLSKPAEPPLEETVKTPYEIAYQTTLANTIWQNRHLFITVEPSHLIEEMMTQYPQYNTIPPIDKRGILAYLHPELVEK